MNDKYKTVVVARSVRITGSSRRIVITLAAAALYTTGWAMAAGSGGIKLDGTLGSSATLSGPTYNISQSLGKVSGNNLFFSFQYFSVGTGETALFSTTTPTLSNVISRVTGGTPSMIDGTIRLSAAGGAPNFFLINPSGVTFTSNAAVDVPAAFHVTTASYLKFPDGNFYADPARASTLSAAQPEAFGFLGQSRATVAIDGPPLSAGSGSGVFDVVAGDVSLTGNGNVAPVAGIFTSTGGIRLAAVGQQAVEVPLTGVFASRDGTVSLQSGAELASGTTDPNGRAGGIDVIAGALTIDGTGSGAQTGLLSFGGGGGGDAIDVQISDSVQLLNGGGIYSQSLPQSPQPAADIKLVTDSLNIEGNNTSAITGVGTNALGPGSGGTIGVKVGTLTINGGNPVNSDYVGIGSTENVSAGVTAASQGNDVAVIVTGATSIANGGEIFASTQSSGHAGNVGLLTGSLSIDGAGAGNPTGLASIALQGSSGEASVVLVESGPIAISNGGVINSDTFGSGSAGGVVIEATGPVSLDGGPAGLQTSISSTAQSGSTGAAGVVGVTTSGTLTIAHGGFIGSDTFGSGPAGGIQVTADSIMMDGSGSQAPLLTGISSSGRQSAAGSAGEVFVNTKGAVALSDAYIESISTGAGNAGDVLVTAGSVSLAGSVITSTADTGSTGAAGHVGIATTGALTLSNAGEVTSDTFGSGNAGEVDIGAGSIAISGAASGISSSTGSNTSGNAGLVVISAPNGAVDVGDQGVIQSVTFGSGHAGGVGITAGSLNVVNGGIVQSDTYAQGAAGVINIIAGSVMIDSQNAPTVTGISSIAKENSTGAAGVIQIDSTGAVDIVNGGIVRSDTFSSGDAGTVTVKAGSVSVDGMGSQHLTGISSSAELNTTGNAGKVIVAASGAVNLQDGGLIQSISSGSGNAGVVGVGADSITLSGPAADSFTGLSSQATGAGGNAGGVAITANTLSIDSGNVAGAVGISSNTYGAAGNAGIMLINVKGTINLTNSASIESVTATRGIGGSITIQAGTVNLSGESVIDTDTQGAGAAGAVTLTVDELNLNKGAVSSSADRSSGGQPGQITINARDVRLDDEGLIEIENDGTAPAGSFIQPALLSIDATGAISLRNGSTISASSTGNVGGSSIQISYGQSLVLDPSYIQTVAFLGDGGSISIVGHGPLILDHSNINASEFGTTSGNGGNIDVTAPFLILDSGVIQGNTLAPLASGGRVSVDVLALIPSSQSYQRGGSLVAFNPAVAGLNVVQAAAPDGLDGALNVTVPPLDLGNSLVSLPGAPAAPPPLARSVCRFTQGSSLAIAGRGGLPPSGFDLLWFDPQDVDGEPVQADDRTSGGVDSRYAALAVPVCR